MTAGYECMNCGVNVTGDQADWDLCRDELGRSCRPRVQSGYVRKGLNTRLREEFDRRVSAGELEAWGAGTGPDGRLLYTFTVPGEWSRTMTPGECADWLKLETPA